MFPFSASASTVDTTQQVYNSATDGIMNMQGKKICRARFSYTIYTRRTKTTKRNRKRNVASI